jgi:quercetin 2,3-dioxygenase
MLDYNDPLEFKPGSKQDGVDYHPHRGFEAVSIVYQGDTIHNDSKGNSRVINAGDVQWMTADSSVLHKEMHSEEFLKKGGIFESIQLWLNLPAKYKMSPAKYQNIKKKEYQS